jgi:amino acid permease
LCFFVDTQTTSVARIFVSFLVAFSYPLLCNPGRNSMISLWSNFIEGKSQEGADDSVGHGKGNSLAVNAKLAREADKERLKREAKLYDFRFAVCTAIFVFGSLGLALVLDDLGVVLALIGATGSTVITFILPGAAYYVMHKDSGPAWKRNGAVMLFCLGCIIMPVCVTFIFV